MINQVVLAGRTTKDIELAYTRNSKACARFTLAVNRGFKDEQGNQQADFINIVAWGKQAENAAKYVKKGSLIGIAGRIETGSYEKNGTTRYTTDVVANQITFLETKKAQQEAGNPHANGYSNNYNHDFSNPNFNPNVGNPNNPFQKATKMVGQVTNGPLINIDDDDLPF